MMALTYNKTITIVSDVSHGVNTGTGHVICNTKVMCKTSYEIYVGETFIIIGMTPQYTPLTS